MAKIVILLMQIEIVQIQLYARRDIFVVSCWEALEASDSLSLRSLASLARFSNHRDDGTSKKQNFFLTFNKMFQTM